MGTLPSPPRKAGSHVTLRHLTNRIRTALRRLRHALFTPVHFYPPPPRPESESRREEDARLRKEQGQRQAAREQVRQECADLHDRVTAKQAAAALLCRQVEDSHRRGKSSQALRQALELERLRQEIRADEEAASAREQVLWSLDFRLRLIERELRRLRCPPPVSPPPPE